MSAFALDHGKRNCYRYEHETATRSRPRHQGFDTMATTNGFPPTLETLRVALNDAVDAHAALERENTRLIGEVTALSEDVIRLRDQLHASRQDGGQ